MPSIEPPHTVGSPALLQSWRDTSFFHWKVEPEAVAALLPEGLEPHLHRHQAWVGLTPFRVEGQRLSGTPPLPWLSSYCESNLRTYVQGPDGDGIWFLTIHATSFPTVLGARTFVGAP